MYGKTKLYENYVSTYGIVGGKGLQTYVLVRTTFTTELRAGGRVVVKLCALYGSLYESIHRIL
jgi:hypothetical protein